MRSANSSPLEDRFLVIGDVPGLHALGLEYESVVARRSALKWRMYSVVCYLGVLALALALGVVALQSPGQGRAWTTIHDVAATAAPLRTAHTERSLLATEAAVSQAVR